MILKVNKEQKQMLKDFIAEVVLNGRAEVKNELQHKIALNLVKSGQAIVLSKKNYGRIAEIKYIGGE